MNGLDRKVKTFSFIYLVKIPPRLLQHFHPPGGGILSLIIFLFIVIYLFIIYLFIKTGQYRL